MADQRGIETPVPSAARSWEMFTSCSAPSGKVLVVLGEAPGQDEEREGIPFIGAAGRTLTNAFLEAGLDRNQWHILNTFLRRPPDNNLKDESWTLNKTEYKRLYGHVPTTPALRKRYLRPEHQWQIEELHRRLAELQPDLIVAMGGTALWALTGFDQITLHRGNFFTSTFGRAIATLHPAALLYQWSNMPLLWADLTKVRKWLAGELPEPEKRKLWVNPDFREISNFYNFLKRMPLTEIGVDIETCPSIGQMTTISFGTTNDGICIPIWDRYCTDPAKQNYWPTVAEEREAWKWIKMFAELPNPKVMQNGLYDSQYLLDAPIEIRVRNWKHDTAIMQHAYQPELQKALGILSSLYLNEPSWKQMRTSAKDAKADE